MCDCMCVCVFVCDVCAQRVCNVRVWVNWMFGRDCAFVRERVCMGCVRGGGVLAAAVWDCALLTAGWFFYSFTPNCVLQCVTVTMLSEDVRVRLCLCQTAGRRGQVGCW